MAKTNTSEKVHTIEIKRSPLGLKSKEPMYMSGTLEQLIKSFSYTLEVGASWDRSVQRSPKTIKSLVSNLYKASNAAAMNGYSGTTYSIFQNEKNTKK